MRNSYSLLILRMRLGCNLRGGKRAVELIDEGKVIEEVDDRITPLVGFGSTGIVGIRRVDGVEVDVEEEDGAGAGGGVGAFDGVDGGAGV